MLVDNGGRDDGWDIIKLLRERCGNRLVAVRLMRKYGQYNALICGLGMLRGDYAVTTKDDLKNPPEEIPQLLEQIKTHCLHLVHGCLSFTVPRLGCNDEKHGWSAACDELAIFLTGRQLNCSPAARQPLE